MYSTIVQFTINFTGIYKNLVPRRVLRRWCTICLIRLAVDRNIDRAASSRADTHLLEWIILRIFDREGSSPCEKGTKREK